jgi:hypothetical protein
MPFVAPASRRLFRPCLNIGLARAGAFAFDFAVVGRLYVVPAATISRLQRSRPGFGQPLPCRCCPPESPPRTHIDAPPDSVYICSVPVRKLQVGQVWKKEDSGESYLVTKVYNEALTTFAILRKAGAESERPVKVKVDRKGPAYALPGFSYAQESDEF